MKEQGAPFEAGAYLPAVSGYYSDVKGNMLSFPFNSSTPILYYNKDLFKKAGLDPEGRPRPSLTSRPTQETPAAGVPCGFTTEWPSYMQFENFSAYHNQPISTKENGLGRPDAELKLNGPLQVRHLQNLVDWPEDQGVRLWRPRRQLKAEVLLGRMRDDDLLGSRAPRHHHQHEVGCRLALLPYYADAKGAPQNSIIAARAYGFCVARSRPTTKAWRSSSLISPSRTCRPGGIKQTGYLPITTAAYELSRRQGFYDKNPGTDVAVKEINLNPPTENSKGLRLGNFLQIRALVEEEIENALQGKKTPQQALDAAVSRGNELLRQFQKSIPDGNDRRPPKHVPLIPAQAGIQGQIRRSRHVALGPRFRGTSGIDVDSIPPEHG